MTRPHEDPACRCPACKEHDGYRVRKLPDYSTAPITGEAVKGPPP